jgi:hypothetical protein
MEPFELRLHQVTFDKSDSDLGQGDNLSLQHLDSFDSLVHYDANLQDKTRVDDSASYQHVAFSPTGKIF